jgi:hypothetical protein
MVNSSSTFKSLKLPEKLLNKSEELWRVEYTRVEGTWKL